MRGSCSLAIAIPVHKHVGHITFPAPEQLEHRSVVESEKRLLLNNILLAEQRAHGKYPVP